MRTTRRRSLLAVAAALPVLIVGAATASAIPSNGPSGQITDVHSQSGTVQYVFSASNLQPGQHLDPSSVVVQAAGQTLTATAAAPTSGHSSGQAPLPVREVVLTLDVSGSMQGDGIAGARAAATSYVRSLPADVRIGLVTFSAKPTVVVPPTTNRGQLVAAIGNVQAGGNTALYDGVITAAGLMQALPANAVRRLVILSDGDDTTSVHSLRDATSILVADHVAADVVAFRIPGDPAVLKTIAGASNGRVLSASNTAGLASAFAAAAQQFDEQLLVTVKIPGSLAGKHETLQTSVNVGTTSLSASTDLTLPTEPGAPAPEDQLVVSAPSASARSNTVLILLSGLAFVAMFVAAMLALWLPASSRRKARERLRLAEANRYQMVAALGVRGEYPVDQVEQERQVTQRVLSVIDRTIRAQGRRDRIVDALDRAGLRIRPEEWVTFQVAAVALLGAVLAVLLHSVVGLLVGGVLGYFSCRVFIKMKTSRRAAAFMQQLPDTLQLVAGSLRSGFSLNQALVGVVQEGSEPTASEFARALTEARLGADLEEALDDVATRMECDDLHWVVMAVRISREIGGNLAEVLQTTVVTMRERAQIRAQVKVLSAEGRISAKILIGLPFFMAGYLVLFKRGYLNPLFNTAIGIALLAVGSVLLLIGGFWVNRLVKIEV